MENLKVVQHLRDLSADSQNRASIVRVSLEELHFHMVEQFKDFTVCFIHRIKAVFQD